MIRKSEKRIVGSWNLVGSEMVADDECKRIDWLINNCLIKIATDFSGWDILYRDPSDNRYWELIYPKSEMHGGGPPSLILLSESDVKDKYGI